MGFAVWIARPAQQSESGRDMTTVGIGFDGLIATPPWLREAILPKRALRESRRDRLMRYEKVWWRRLRPGLGRLNCGSAVRGP